MGALDSAVFVVDGDAAARVSTAALVASMGLSCRTFATAEQFIETAVPSQVGCLVVDLCLEGMDLRQFKQRLVAAGIALPMVLIGANVTVEHTVRAMRMGAVSVLEKPYRADELAEAICEAVAISRNTDVANHGVDAHRACFETLDLRERQVMSLIVSGMPNKTIARELGVCQRTAAQIRAKVFKKMNADSAVDLALMASALWRRESQPA